VISLTKLDKIYLLEPNAAPLYVLVSKLNKRVAISTSIEWLEDDLNPTWTTSSCYISTSDTNITAAAAYFNVYDLIKFPVTGEVCLVTAATTAVPPQQITVTRAYGATSAVSVAKASDIVIIGSAFAEGSAGTDLTAYSTQTSRKINYLQIFRKAVQITKTLANSELLNLGALFRNR
jgi:hypothetical protein